MRRRRSEVAAEAVCDQQFQLHLAHSRRGQVARTGEIFDRRGKRFLWFDFGRPEDAAILLVGPFNAGHYPAVRLELPVV